jgi:hypothetical protein
MTQNNLGITLWDLAGALDGEERQARLEEAVDTYREALRFYTAEAAPLQHATVMGNLQRALGDLEEHPRWSLRRLHRRHD